MDKREAGLIDDLLAGAKGDFAAAQTQSDLPDPVSMIFAEAMGLLTRASAYKLNSQHGHDGGLDTRST